MSINIKWELHLQNKISKSCNKKNKCQAQENEMEKVSSPKIKMKNHSRVPNINIFQDTNASKWLDGFQILSWNFGR